MCIIHVLISDVSSYVHGQITEQLLEMEGWKLVLCRDYLLFPGGDVNSKAPSSKYPLLSHGNTVMFSERRQLKTVNLQ